MTREELRDHFAGIALAGMIRCSGDIWGEKDCADRVGQGCYALADGMLKAREIGRRVTASDKESVPWYANK